MEKVIGDLSWDNDKFVFQVTKCVDGYCWTVGIRGVDRNKHIIGKGSEKTLDQAIETMTNKFQVFTKVVLDTYTELLEAK